MNILKNIIKKFRSHELARDSSIVFVGSMASNVIAYLYHLLMGRFLGPEGYGELSSLVSILYIFTVPLNVGQITLVKFVSQMKAQNAVGQVKTLFTKVTKMCLIASVIVFPIVVVISPFIVGFLHIESPVLFIFVYITFVFSLLTVVMGSVLQGYQKFIWISLLGCGMMLIKLLLSIFGTRFGVFGVMMATVVASAVTYFIYFIPLGFVFRVKEAAMTLTKHQAVRYAIPTLLTILGMTSLFSADIILVRHFFSSYEAGLYASLAVLGKVIFYASSAVTVVLFPVLSERLAKKEDTAKLIKTGVLGVSALSVAIIAIYAIVPKFIVSMLFGTAYLDASGLLGIFGLFLALYSVGNVIVMACMAIGKTNIWLFPLGSTILQVVSIVLYHQTIAGIIWINIFVSAFLVLGSMVYYRYSKS